MKNTKTQSASFLQNLGIDSDFIVQRNLPCFTDAENLVVADVSQSGRKHELIHSAATAWRAMKTKAHSDGISLIIISAYRSFERQCEIVQHSIDQGEDITAIFKISAPPGYSEHHTGKAIDIGTMGCEPLSREFDDTDAYKWLTQNAKEFGFRLTYPKNNKFGFTYEPWHWFYIGKTKVRKVKINELEQLKELGKKTFSETFAGVNSKEDMETYLSDKFSTEHLTKELNCPNSEFYFAELDNKIIGYLKINLGSAQTENYLPDALEIERIYVLGEFHGRAIGKILFDKAVEIARALTIKILWLGVWEENTKAIRFYQRQGFEKFAEHKFALGEKIDNDWLMKLELY